MCPILPMGSDTLGYRKRVTCMEMYMLSVGSIYRFVSYKHRGSGKSFTRKARKEHGMFIIVYTSVWRLFVTGENGPSDCCWWELNLLLAILHIWWGKEFSRDQLLAWYILNLVYPPPHSVLLLVPKTYSCYNMALGPQPSWPGPRSPPRGWQDPSWGTFLCQGSNLATHGSDCRPPKLNRV